MGPLRDDPAGVFPPDTRSPPRKEKIDRAVWDVSSVTSVPANTAASMGLDALTICFPT